MCIYIYMYTYTYNLAGQLPRRNDGGATPSCDLAILCEYTI